MSQNKEWTIMIYMAGDNNLSVDMSYALQRIKETITAESADVNLLVYYDGASPVIPTLYCDFSKGATANYFRSFKIKNKLRDAMPEFDENSAAEDSVVNFVDWCVNKVEHVVDGKKQYGRKANKYALIFSGHTFGFQNIGLFKDETSNHTMTMRSINRLLERITKSKIQLELDARAAQTENKKPWTAEELAMETTEIIGRKLDILGFDSCVMGMLEVGYEFTSAANTMVASEGSIPNAGWTYAQIFKNILSGSPDVDVNATAKSFVEQFIYTQNSYTVGGVSVDMAAWDLTKLHHLETPFKNLVQSLFWCFEDPKSIIYKQMKKLLLQVHWECQSYMSDQNIDLGDFCNLLIKEIKSLKEEIKDVSFNAVDTLMGCCYEVLKALRDCVILSGFSGGNFQYSNGISLFFPWTLDAYDVASLSYEQLKFIETTDAGKKWNQFLIKYLEEITLRGSKPLSDNPNEPVYHSFKYPEEANGKLSQISRAFYTGLLPNNNLSFSKEMIAMRDELLFDEEIDAAMPIIAKCNGNGLVKTAVRTLENIKVRTPENIRVRTPENILVRTPENIRVRTPENIKVRMLNDLGLYFNEFLNYKNIQTQWNLSGFSKQVVSINKFLASAQITHTVLGEDAD